MNRITAGVVTLVLLGFALPLTLSVGRPSAQAGMATSTATSPVRILIVGDSITQGRGKASPSGGYSWRYFLWKRFASGAADLVGNRTGPSQGTSATAQSPVHYADPNFDYDHAALAGATLAQPDPAGGYYPIGRLVRTYHPRVIVAMWGTNDIRQGATAESVIRLYTSWLRTVRAEDPDVDVVIARLPWTWMSPQVGRLNAQLPVFAAAYSTARSRVVLAQARDGYSRADTYDGLHPHRHGEEKIAAMVSSSLRALGLPITAAPILPGNVFAPVTRPATPSLVLRRQQGTVAVRWSARARAGTYTLRCNGVDRHFQAPRTTASLRSAAAVLCRVRASNYAGSSAWSEAVRVGRRRG